MAWMRGSSALVAVPVEPVEPEALEDSSADSSAAIRALVEAEVELKEPVAAASVVGIAESAAVSAASAVPAEVDEAELSAERAVSSWLSPPLRRSAESAESVVSVVSSELKRDESPAYCAWASASAKFAAVVELVPFDEVAASVADDLAPVGLTPPVAAPLSDDPLPSCCSNWRIWSTWPMASVKLILWFIGVCGERLRLARLTP